MGTFTLFPFVFVLSEPGLEREMGFLVLSMLAKVPLLMLFYFGIVARSGTVWTNSCTRPATAPRVNCRPQVVFERLDGAAFNATGSPSSSTDTELYISFGATVGSVALLALAMYRTGKWIGQSDRKPNTFASLSPSQTQ